MIDEKDKVYYEDAGVLRHQSEKWEKDLYGFFPLALGDVGSNTACKSIELNTTKYMEVLRRLLIDNKRWPDELQERYSDRIAKTKLRYGWSKFVHWVRYLPHKLSIPWAKTLSEISPRLYRTQHGMTRDPFTWYFCAVAHFDLHLDDPDYWVSDVMDEMPKYLRRRGLTAWVRYLETQDYRYFDKYVRIAMWQLRLPRRVFALNQARMRAKVVGAEEVLKLINSIEPIPNKG